jgi:ATP-dependent protease ClpP protease subunit
MKWHFKTNSNTQVDEVDSEETKVISIEKHLGENNPTGNKLYLYSDITRESILTLNRQIDEMSRQMKQIQFTFNLPEPPCIELHVCSDGGDIFAAMASVDKISNNSVPIYTFCEGIVASAASLLTVVGKKRFITPSSCMLIHQISSGLWGNYMEFKDEIKNLELVMNFIRNVYMKRTKFKSKELDKILSHDLYLSSEKCLEVGLVDIIQ